MSTSRAPSPAARRGLPLLVSSWGGKAQVSAVELVALSHMSVPGRGISGEWGGVLTQPPWWFLQLLQDSISSLLRFAACEDGVSGGPAPGCVLLPSPCSSCAGHQQRSDSGASARSLLPPDSRLSLSELRFFSSVLQEMGSRAWGSVPWLPL